MHLELLAVAAFGLGGACSLFLGRKWRSRLARRRVRTGQRGEKRALRLARRSGFRVLGEQVQGTVELRIDGELHTATVKADLLLEKRGRRYIGEVKTGSTYAEPTAVATRRQLFEYAWVFGGDGLLLFDMESELIREVRFGRTSPARIRNPLLGRAALLLLGILVGLLLARM